MPKFDPETAPFQGISAPLLILFSYILHNKIIFIYNQKYNRLIYSVLHIAHFEQKREL